MRKRRRSKKQSLQKLLHETRRTRSSSTKLCVIFLVHQKNKRKWSASQTIRMNINIHTYTGRKFRRCMFKCMSQLRYASGAFNFLYTLCLAKQKTHFALKFECELKYYRHQFPIHSHRSSWYSHTQHERTNEHTILNPFLMHNNNNIGKMEKNIVMQAKHIHTHRAKAYIIHPHIQCKVNGILAQICFPYKQTLSWRLLAGSTWLGLAGKNTARTCGWKLMKVKKKNDNKVQVLGLLSNNDYE